MTESLPYEEAKVEALAKLNRCIATCDQVQAYLFKASQSLQRNYSGNGYGIYSDKQHVMSIAVAARDELNKAISALSAMESLSDDEYDKL